MYIKSMVIDGFKSYGQRTEINGFDPLFNAITGLNGSGKSNILDSICFLLGITNLSQVRASNLQELVYKNGQAGVTKATVSITFDNSDKNQCPVGYENYEEITVTRQVVIGGRNKYLINGCNAQNNRVQDLFGSVQLNVNNPHFLIMQGRITKVLNMKPAEILSMLEEAAGTRMYESKRQTAQKTIEKKDAKLAEINKLLSEEITPTLKRLKAERQAYMDYTKVLRELEHLTKLQVAYRYSQFEESTRKAGEKYNALQKSIEDQQETIQKNETEKANLTEQISLLEKRKDEELGGKLQSLEEVLKQHQMKEAKIGVDLKHYKDNLKEESNRKKELQKNVTEESATLTKKTKELEDLISQCQEIIDKGKSDSQALEAAKQHFKAVSSGLSSNADGEEATLAEQLITAKKEIADSETEIKQSEMRLKHTSAQLKKKREELKKTESTFEKDNKALSGLVNELEKLRKQLTSVKYQEGTEERLAEERLKLQREIQRGQEEIDKFESQFPNLNFNYHDPEPGFDRTKVHGLVCKLIRVKKPETAKALEVTAGGRLYNVVVDNELVGKKILDKGRLRQRVTIIPLNKIADHSIRPDIVHKAERLVGNEHVDLALSLIGYAPAVEAAMRFVFGGSFICPDMDSAKALAFNRDVSRRCVTLDGDVFEPAGTLTGGSRSNDRSLLVHLSRIHDLQNALNDKKESLARVNEEFAAIRSSRDQYHAIKQRLDPKEEEVALIRRRIEMSSHNQQLEEIKGLETAVQTETDSIEASSEVTRKNQEKAKELELKIKDSKKYRERELKVAEDNLTKCKKESEQSSKLSKVKEQAVNTMKLEIEELNKGLTTYKENLEEVEKAITTLTQQTGNVEEQLKEAKDCVEKASNDVKTQKEELKAQMDEINQLQKKWNKYDKEINHCKLQIQQLEHDCKKCKDDGKEIKEKLKNLVNKNEWIENEKQFFGAPNTEYDFQATNMKDVDQRILKLVETKDKLSKSVNMRAQNMMTQTEEQYQDLLKRKQIVENDKSKISKVIEELDVKKKLALKDAWEKVNKDFGSIFSTLLPGTSAKLVPPEGLSCTDGLEIKVAFGSVWKESLNELSGGQRSLVALSLILSLLLFKPAPIYILDEVDAALDLSHTQNIGQMLRTHFKHSQFIIVSLKDGMFNNANVLFKTKFVDGVSNVSRHTQRSK